MPVEVIFPKVDMDMESGLLAEWLCKHGDQVDEGQPIFVIETDKSAMEIESLAAGRIAINEPAVGATHAVGKVIASIYQQDEPFDTIDHPSVSEGPLACDEQGNKGAVESTAANDGGAVQPMPLQVGHSELTAVDAVRASPAARRVAAEHGIVLAGISGTARNGRIIKADVLALVSDVAGRNAQASASAGGLPLPSTVAPHATISRMSAPHTATPHTSTPHTATPHTVMRRTIAQRLTHSVQTIPSYQVVVDCECESLVNTAEEVNAGISRGLVKAEQNTKVSLNVFFLRALALTLAEIKQANSQWTEDEMLMFDQVDLGFAVALDNGLITPVIPGVDSKSVVQIATEVSALIDRARSNRLLKTEYQGGVSTVSNLGMYGIPEFTSIINPPQSSIVSIGTVAPAAVVQDNSVCIKPMCRATFTFDHRVIDGAVGARVASLFKDYVEHSVRLLL
jgi:pyruvate dehydrogenase E2 component (dihydrolipoamide acetyltransferase)